MSHAADGAQQWSRRALQRTLAGVLAAAVLLVAGLVYAAHTAITANREAAGTQPGQEEPVAGPGEAYAGLPSGQARRDAIAAEAMLAVGPEAMLPGQPAATIGPAIRIPAAGRVGPAEVATGFPRTPQGAIGQLAAIETRVLQAMSIPAAHTLYEQWSAPDAPPAGSWAMVTNIAAFLGAAGDSDAVSTAVRVIPVAAQVKGVDGPDWTVACVLVQVQARIATAAAMAYGHCERMRWLTDERRWVIAAGDPPARAPSTWPETDLAREAGWRTWVEAADHVTANEVAADGVSGDLAQVKER